MIPAGANDDHRIVQQNFRQVSEFQCIIAIKHIRYYVLYILIVGRMAAVGEGDAHFRVAIPYSFFLIVIMKCVGLRADTGLELSISIHSYSDDH